MTRQEIKSIDADRQQTHISIPVEFMDEEYNFSPLELLLIAMIHSFSKAPNYCYASNEYFAKKFKVSEVTVSKSINKLITLGYVKKISFDGRNRKIACFIDTQFGDKKK